MIAPCEAQIFPPSNLWLNTSTYSDLSTLHERVATVDDDCPAGDCNLDCITVLQPLLDTCRDVLNTLLDGLDGVEDGMYRPLTDLVDTCN
eukprot:SAG11_NODE_8_length_31217_cov_52.169677_1_plen_89_part_10